MASFRHGKIDDCNNTSSLIDGIGDACIGFHLHRVCASASKLRHVVKLMPHSVIIVISQRFDYDQITFYSQSNYVPMTPMVRQQVSLPVRYGGHRFKPLVTPNTAAYAASLVDSASVNSRHQAREVKPRPWTYGYADRHLLDFVQ
eukprot:GFKZ01015246.1.p1 GENE.GFKZ01015246.1~~GFKZ01015246.1.p1  ORF type:complete len:145 (-),score=3.22 GFKZ01015246.1:96-530(-)